MDNKFYPLVRESVREMRVLELDKYERRKVIEACYNLVGRIFHMPYELPEDLGAVIKTGKRGASALEMLDDILNRREIVLH